MRESRLRVFWDVRQMGKCSLVEHLRYAGLIGDVKTNYRDDGDSDGIVSFTMYPPKHITKASSATWAKNNHDRMRSFGIRTEIVEE